MGLRSLCPATTTSQGLLSFFASAFACWIHFDSTGGPIRRERLTWTANGTPSAQSDISRPVGPLRSPPSARQILSSKSFQAALMVAPPAERRRGRWPRQCRPRRSRRAAARSFCCSSTSDVRDALRTDVRMPSPDDGEHDPVPVGTAPFAQALVVTERALVVVSPLLLHSAAANKVAAS